MKNRRYRLHFQLLLLLVTLAACDPHVSPADSIAVAPYYQNQSLIEHAWQLPVARTYRNRFEYQINRLFCRPATVVNVFYSLNIERFTQNTVFDRTKISYWKARFLGLNLDELATLIRDNAPLEVEIMRDLSLESFREAMRHANDPGFRYLINFNRQPLFGVRVGHHSPIGGYLQEWDLVFVLDVLDDYRPFLVPVARLFEAMDTIDSETGRKRGLLRINAAAESPTS